MPNEAGFLNVDLEVGARSRARLAPLADALHGKLFELFRGRIGGLYRVHYEVNAIGRTASATIHALAKVIETLDARVWAAATMRDFNVGLELARGVRSLESVIDARAIQRVAALGGRIVVTAYQSAAIPRGRLRRPTYTPSKASSASRSSGSP